MRPALILLALIAMPLAACRPPSGSSSEEPRSVTVFAASSLTEAFTEMANAFEQGHPRVKVILSLAGSQTLRAQLQAGAAADVFVSADTASMDALVADGMVEPGAPQILLSNHLVVILPASNPAGLERLQQLSGQPIKLVLAAEEVPAGRYARQALAKMNARFGADFASGVMRNVVSNESNVKQVVAKVQLGEADAGIAYASDVAAAPDLLTIQIPPELNSVARYPVAVLSGSADPGIAAEFVAYTLSASGQAILSRWGFSPPH